MDWTSFFLGVAAMLILNLVGNVILLWWAVRNFKT